MVPPEEWSAFYKKLQQPLDICFRVNTIGNYKIETKAKLESYIAKMQTDETMRDKIPQEVSWYPHPGMVYTFNEMSRTELR